MNIPLDDRGLLLADGLFETLLWSDSRLVFGREHGERMIHGAGVIGLPPPGLGTFLACAEAAVGDAGLTSDRAAVRVTFTAGSGGRGLDRPDKLSPRLFATAAKAPRPQGPATLVISSVRRNAGSPASRLKTLAYLDNVLARREAMVAGADEAVMLNTDGWIACAAVANIFWIAGTTLFTPPLDCGCLDGVMRGAVLRAAADVGLAVREPFAGPGVLAEADAIFVTNSLTGVRAANLYGHPAPARHNLVERLQQALAPVS